MVRSETLMRTSSAGIRPITKSAVEELSPLTSQSTGPADGPGKTVQADPSKIALVVPPGASTEYDVGAAGATPPAPTGLPAAKIGNRPGVTSTNVVAMSSLRGTSSPSAQSRSL